MTSKLLLDSRLSETNTAVHIRAHVSFRSPACVGRSDRKLHKLTLTHKFRDGCERSSPRAHAHTTRQGIARAARRALHSGARESSDCRVEDEGFGFGARSTTESALPASRGDFPAPVVAAQLAARRYQRHAERSKKKKMEGSCRLELKARFDHGFCLSHRNWATGQASSFSVPRLFTRVNKPYVIKTSFESR